MAYRRLLLPVVLLAAVVFAADEQTGTGKRESDPVSTAPDTATRDRSGPAVVPADSVLTAPAATSALCTLDIATEPTGAAISLDGRQVGVAPLVITDVDTGKHAIIIQKSGYYQKKATVLMTSAQRSTLHFQLSAPGRLTVITEPAGALVRINGEPGGKSPYVDSVVKPGTYFLSLEKEHFRTVADSVTVPGGGALTRIDTLRFTDAYRDSLEGAAAVSQKRRTRIGFGIVAGAFGVFLLVLAIIERPGR